MAFPSITTILGVAFLAYSAHSMWQMAQLFTTLKCTDVPCYHSFLTHKPRMQLALYISTNMKPLANEVEQIELKKPFDYWNDFHKEYHINIPGRTKRNSTLYIQMVLADEGQQIEWKTIKRTNSNTMIHAIPITQWIEPIAETFQLLRDRTNVNGMKKPLKANGNINTKPRTHIMSEVHVTMLTDTISLSEKDLPPELGAMVQVNSQKQIMPILKVDFFKTSRKHLVLVTKQMDTFKINFYYKPIGIGKLRLMLLVEHAMKTMESAGLPKQDIDELKSLFSDTNLYLLLITIFVASVHMLFDFLSFKNDIAFWHKKKSYEGLSSRTIMWRAFSQMIIFLYLMDEKTSMLVLVPAGIGVIIELWKCKKILKLTFPLKKHDTIGQPPLNNQILKQYNSGRAAEQQTEEFDKQGMKYLSYILYPLCVAGAIYSLLYQPHRSWYSWTVNSLVNGVYAFGFLLMLPQLFVNYKLKSVAALPWRAFMYKAFNTFIDDFFAFIITMPTAHRVACLRDDVVFLIYLYQRWLYPVDKNRIDIGSGSSEMMEINPADQTVTQTETEANTKIEKNQKNQKID